MPEEKIYRLYLPWATKAYLLGTLFVLLVVTVLAFVMPFIVTGPDAPPAFIGVFFLFIVGGNLFWILRLPHQILLHGDATIEFRAVIRKVRMNPIEIASLKPANGTFGFIIVKGKKKVRLLAQFDDFHEFVLKLKQLNPSVIVRGC
jgi:hypothetical protein